MDPRLASINLDPGTGELDDDDQVNVTLPADATAGTRRIKASFGWQRTNNEEVAVTSCGVVLGRGTFHVAEGPMGVIVSHLCNSGST